LGLSPCIPVTIQDLGGAAGTNAAGTFSQPVAFLPYQLLGERYGIDIEPATERSGFGRSTP
jgi:hypothetical protein